MPDSWKPYIARIRSGEFQSFVFRDIILDELRHRASKPTVLDIGCGKGILEDFEIQKTIANASGRYIGVEPDPEIEFGRHFYKVHRCTFDEAEIEPGSIDVAFAIMVMEHVDDPVLFCNKLHQILSEGGVFLGITPDMRHYFSWMSMTFEKLGIKERYLDKMLGRRAEDRYMTYPTRYRVNTPRRGKKYFEKFRRYEPVNLCWVGQVDQYVPRWMFPLTHFLDRTCLALSLPGPILMHWAEK